MCAIRSYIMSTYELWPLPQCRVPSLRGSMAAFDELDILQPTRRYESPDPCRKVDLCRFIDGPGVLREKLLAGRTGCRPR